jgi:hypothetical protein
VGVINHISFSTNQVRDLLIHNNFSANHVRELLFNYSFCSNQVRELLISYIYSQVREFLINKSSPPPNM